MLKKYLLILCVIIFISSAVDCSDKSLKIVTTTTDLKWLCIQIVGDKGQVSSLLNGNEDPHYVDALPSFIRKTSKADLVCSIGLSLEIGWLPKVLQKSAKKKIQPGGMGYLEVGREIDVIEVPVGGVDRSMGDMHKEGNPHFWLSPTCMVKAGETILNRINLLRPNSKDKFIKNFNNFKNRMKQLSIKLKLKLKMIDKPVVQYHKSFSYFFKEFNIRCFGTIEETPGVSPSAGRLAKFSLKCKKNNVVLALASHVSPEKKMKKFQKISEIPFRILPVSIQEKGKIDSYEKLLNSIAEALVNK